ncbi:MAG: nitroreductase family protein, partial [Nanoarchaeota archaeon]|nr:nitroreductase family protein [Nanoarchaeota archaeon]
MDFDKVIETRHSSRTFKPKRVNFGDILDSISAAIQGPFAGNMNNIKFIVIEDNKTIKTIAKHANQIWINEAPALVVVCADETNLENQYGKRGNDYSRQQAGAAIGTLILKLTDLKINSCWIGAFDYEIVKEILKIPQNIRIEAIIPIGYEKGKGKAERKLDLESVTRWEDFKTTKRPSI